MRPRLRRPTQRAMSKSPASWPKRRLASLYAGIVRMQSVGGVAKPTDPVGAVVMRLARRRYPKGKGFGYRGRAEEEGSGWLLSIGWLPNMRSRMMRH